MFLFIFLNYWFLLFNSSSYCINLYSYYRNRNSYRNTKQRSKCRNLNTSNNCRSWNKNVSNIIQSCANLFMLSIHQFIFPYFSKKKISCVIYIFQSKLLTHIFKVVIYFQLNHEFSISQFFFSSSCLQSRQTIERTNAFLKMYDNLSPSNFLYSPQITQ